jgi:hypothetical protein
MGVEMGSFSVGVMQLMKMIKIPVVPVFYEGNKVKWEFSIWEVWFNFGIGGRKQTKRTNNN